jgi:hypothetical protein
VLAPVPMRFDAFGASVTATREAHAFADVLASVLDGRRNVS